MHHPRRPRPAWLACLALVSLFAAACGSSPAHPTTTTAPRPSGTVGPAPSPGDLKPVLRGLLDRSGAPAPEFYGTLAGYVVNARWSDLQPAAGAPIADGNAIDQAIAQVRQINAAAHTDLGLKVRIFAGTAAPEWAKELGGSPITVTDPQGGHSGTIGRFWSQAFGQAYDLLQSELAAKYDPVSEVREVTIARCTTLFAEPFIRDVADASTVQALLGAGYSVQADSTCQQQEVTAHLVWRHTHSDLSFNPYQVVNADGSTGVDEGFTESMMEYCRNVLGKACILENNSLRDKVGAAYAAMYAKMQSLGPPLAIQTATSARVGDLMATLSRAISLGATSVELPSGYQATVPSALSGVQRALAANPTAA